MSKVLFALVMCVLAAQGGDWLLDPSPYRVEVRDDGVGRGGTSPGVLQFGG